MAVPRISERFLRYVWQHRIFNSSPLVTPDGLRVVVRSPGVLNADGGPDFTGASIRIGHVLYRGDVELHVRASSWKAHGHCSDPHYNRVILHVALLPSRRSPPPRTASGRVVPLLVLSPFVDPLLYTRWRNGLQKETDHQVLCCMRKRPVPARMLREKLCELGRRRMERRVRILGNRLGRLIEEGEAGSGRMNSYGETIRTAAWDQILYECLLEGMGYAANGPPFLALARSVPLQLLKRHGLGDRRTMQALLFGAAGLLPPMHTVRESESRAYVRMLRRRWRALRPLPQVSFQHEGDWRFFRLRPVNFPTARIAAFCFLLPSLFAGQLLDRILALLRRPDASPADRRRVLFSLFRFSPDRFWSRHVHFRGLRCAGGIALGEARVRDLIVNGIIPLLLLYARLSHETGVRRRSFDLLRALPREGENRVTRLVLGAIAGGKPALSGPMERQGMLHLYRLYCSRTRCDRCPVRSGPRRKRAPLPERNALSECHTDGHRHVRRVGPLGENPRVFHFEKKLQAEFDIHTGTDVKGGFAAL